MHLNWNYQLQSNQVTNTNTMARSIHELWMLDEKNWEKTRGREDAAVKPVWTEICRRCAEKREEVSPQAATLCILELPAVSSYSLRLQSKVAIGDDQQLARGHVPPRSRGRITYPHTVVLCLRVAIVSCRNSWSSRYESSSVSPAVARV
jgi:hypothetical protein